MMIVKCDDDSDVYLISMIVYINAVPCGLHFSDS